MARARKVALLGNSVVASSLASTLRGQPDLEVMQLDAPIPEALMRLREVHPDAIILCELAAVSPDLIFQILGQYPGVLVIGADVGGGRMMVLSGRQSSLRTEDDLLEALRRPACPESGSCAATRSKREADSLVEGNE